MNVTGRPTKTLAWEGILAQIPDEWSPTVLSGDRRRGFVRVTDLEAIRMELRWEPFRGPWDPDHVEERYRRLLRKSARRTRTRIDIFEETIPDAGDPEPRSLVVSEPRAVSYHRLMRWNDDRVVFARVETRPKRDRKLARRILAGIRPATVGDEPWDRADPRTGRETWSVFGLTAEPGCRWRRTDHQLSTGMLRLVFTDGSRRLVLEQQSLGQRLVEDRGLDGLLDAVGRTAEIRSRNSGDTTWRGHPVRYLRGRGRVPLPTRRRRWLRGVARRLRLRRDSIAAVWWCEPSDKILAVTAFGMDDPATALDAAGVVCHPSGGVS